VLHSTTGTKDTRPDFISARLAWFFLSRRYTSSRRVNEESEERNACHAALKPFDLCGLRAHLVIRSKDLDWKSTRLDRADIALSLV